MNRARKLKEDEVEACIARERALSTNDRSEKEARRGSHR